jgi:hypothetical protein
MQHISNSFACAILSCGIQHTNLDLLNFKMSFITILSFVGQSDIAKDEAYHKANKSQRMSVSLTSLNLIAKH